MINKYGNDFKNNIFWNKEYPFIPEVTNDFGFTIHEGDIVDHYCKYEKRTYTYRVYKIYSKDFIWTQYYHPYVKLCNSTLNANELMPHTCNRKPPILQDFDNQDFFNPLEAFLGEVYATIYHEELKLENDWHFDDVKFEAKRMEEVSKIKNKC